jgi:chemotaxis protein methyltransferase CheR
LCRFDVIFCRNVISSFDEPTRQSVLAQLAGALADDGWLVLGADERVGSASDALRPVVGRGGFYSLGQQAQAAA